MSHKLFNIFVLVGKFYCSKVLKIFSCIELDMLLNMICNFFAQNVSKWCI